MTAKKEEIKDKKFEIATTETVDQPEAATEKKKTAKKEKAEAAAPSTNAEDKAEEKSTPAKAPEKKKKGFGSIQIENIEEYEKANHKVRPGRFSRRDRKFVATIEGEDKYKKKMSEDTQTLAALIQSEKTGTVLTGKVFGDEPVKNSDLRVMTIKYGTYKVIIPDNFFLELPPEKDAEKRNILSRRTGTVVDFVIKKIDPESKVALGNRLEAMEIRRRRYWFALNNDAKSADDYHFAVGSKLQARIVSTAKTCIHVEVFGVETRIMVQDLSYSRIPDAQREFNVGDTITVMVMKVDRDPKTFDVNVQTSVKAAIEDPRIRAMDMYVKGGEYEGQVTMLDTTSGSGLIFVRLEGIDVACSWVRDYPVVIGDKVKILITGVNEEKLQMSGLIRHVVKRAV